MDICLPCARSFHSECERWDDGNCCCPKEEETPTPIFSEIVTGPKRGRPVQAKIGTSAGRKRAAEVYDSEMGEDKPCEWRFMANCGGGLKPISGCVSGTRNHIHHGPIKNTSHNERSNISLICELCHNRWHAANNPVYKEEAFALLPKQPRLMTIEECAVAISKEMERLKKNEKKDMLA